MAITDTSRFIHTIQSDVLSPNFYTEVLRNTEKNLCFTHRDEVAKELSPMIEKVISESEQYFVFRSREGILGKDLELKQAFLEAFPTGSCVVDWLVQDVSAQVNFFSIVSGENYPFISFRIIIGGEIEKGEAKASRHFHRDSAALTLVCSYAGPGMEWVANNNVNREIFEQRHMQKEGEPDELFIKDTSQIFQFPTMAVGILKGELRPDEKDLSAKAFTQDLMGLKFDVPFNIGKGLIHRGPPQPKDKKRLIVTVSSFTVPQGFVGE